MSPMPPIYLPSTFTPYFYCRWRALLLLCAIGKYILYAITVMIVFCSIPKPVPNATHLHPIYLPSHLSSPYPHIIDAEYRV